MDSNAKGRKGRQESNAEAQREQRAQRAQRKSFFCVFCVFLCLLCFSPIGANLCQSVDDNAEARRKQRRKEGGTEERKSAERNLKVAKMGSRTPKQATSPPLLPQSLIASIPPAFCVFCVFSAPICVICGICGSAPPRVQPNPCLCAHTAAWVRSSTPSLSRMLLT